MYIPGLEMNLQIQKESGSVIYSITPVRAIHIGWMCKYVYVCNANVSYTSSKRLHALCDTCSNVILCTIFRCM